MGRGGDLLALSFALTLSFSPSLYSKLVNCPSTEGPEGGRVKVRLGTYIH